VTVEQTVALAPREQRDVVFRAEALSADREFVHFSLPAGDALPVDNDAWLLVQTSSHTPVVVLSDDSPASPGTAAYYLMRAFTPDPESGGRFLARHLQTRNLTPESIQATRIIAAGYLAALSEAHAKLLVDFVRRGGALLFFSGDGPVDRNLQTLSDAAGGDAFLPWAPGPRRTSISQRDPARIGSGRWQSRWLRQFDEQSRIAIEQIQFGRVWSAGAVATEAEVLLLFQGGEPALAARAFGEGQFVLATFSPEATSSDLARHGAFVALLQMLAQAAAPLNAAAPRVFPGQPLQFSESFDQIPAASLTATGPDNAPAAVTTNQLESGLAVSLPKVEQGGFYRLLSNDRLLTAMAVNLDARESNLERVSAADVERRLKASGALVQHAAAADEEVLSLRGRPLWGSFFAAALFCIGTELLLLGLWRR
jgi:hypothetical protein